MIAQGIVSGIAQGVASGLAEQFGWSPLSLFNAGQGGATYRNTIASNVWADSARTTPATLGARVGAFDDISGNARHQIQATAALMGTYVGDASTYSAEMNPDVSMATVWVAGTGWVIAAGVATATGATGNLKLPAAGLVANTTYEITYGMTRTVGSQTPKLTGTTTMSSSAKSTNGTFTILIRAETGNNALEFVPATFTGTITLVSIRQVTGWVGPYGVHTDGAAQFYAEAGTHTLSLPFYMIAAYKKTVGGTIAYLNSSLDTSNGCFLQNVSGTDAISARLAITAIGGILATGTTSEVPLETKVVSDSYNVAGTTDIGTNNNAVVTAANTWVANTIALSKFRLSSGSGGAAMAGVFYGGAVVLGTVTAANRRRAHNYFGRLIGVSL